MSRTTGGRKEGTEVGRWLCLSFPFLVNRGFGNRTSNWESLASDTIRYTHTTRHSPVQVPVRYCSLLSCPSFLFTPSSSLSLFINSPHAPSVRSLTSFPLINSFLSRSLVATSDLSHLIYYPRLCVNIQIKVPICVSHVLRSHTVTICPFHLSQ